MAKFYHIVGISYDYNPDIIQMGYYLGRTSDLDFKVEPDKTIELDNGINEVGSEKMSLSFSLLDEINNNDINRLKTILLIPEQDLSSINSGDFAMLEIKIPQMKFINNIKLELEEKSGEFQKHWLKLKQRYDVNHKPYRFIMNEDYYEDYLLLLMENINYNNANYMDVVMDDW